MRMCSHSSRSAEQRPPFATATTFWTDKDGCMRGIDGSRGDVGGWDIGPVIDDGLSLHSESQSSKAVAEKKALPPTLRTTTERVDWDEVMVSEHGTRTRIAAEVSPS